MSFHRYTVRKETENSLANNTKSVSSCIRFRACSLNSGVLFFHVFHVRGTLHPQSLEVVTFPTVSLLGVSPILYSCPSFWQEPAVLRVGLS